VDRTPTLMLPPSQSHRSLPLELALRRNEGYLTVSQVSADVTHGAVAGRNRARHTGTGRLQKALACVHPLFARKELKLVHMRHQRCCCTSKPPFLAREAASRRNSKMGEWWTRRRWRKTHGKSSHDVSDRDRFKPRKTSPKLRLFLILIFFAPH
jgi:hypothetical protein